MNNFGVLYKYECKKLLCKKIVWISFSACIAFLVASYCAPFFGDYYIDGKMIGTNRQMMQIDGQFYRDLDGRTLDQALLEETIAAYREIPETVETHYTSTEEYQEYARPYSAIFTFVRRLMGMATSELMYSWEPDEVDMYARWQAQLASRFERLGLSEGERAFWRERGARIETPYVYREHERYGALFSNYQGAWILMLMLIGVALSGMFSEEHARRTDQIILSSPLGKTRLYWAKFAAGISFAVVSTFAFIAVSCLMTRCLYGTGGFQAAFQLLYADCPEPITCGEAMGIAYGSMLAAAVAVGIFVMLLSELLHSNIAALSVSMGLLLLTMMVVVPEQYRIPAQIWSWLPWCFLAPQNLFGQYTLYLFGHYLAPWQAVPLLYVLAGASLAAIGKPVYQRFQINGR